jgi:Zn-dependent protease
MTLAEFTPQDASDYAAIAFLGFALILLVPLLRRCRYTTSRILQTDADTAWSALVGYGPLSSQNRDQHPALPAALMASREISAQPKLVEEVMDLSGGHGQIVRETVWRIIAEDAPRRFVREVEKTGGRKPVLSRIREETTFEPVESGTKVTIVRHIPTPLFIHYLLFRLIFASSLNRAALYFATGTVPKSGSFKPSARGLLLISLASAGFMAVCLGWKTSLYVSGALLVHEFGHWLAMRVMGHKSARFFLMPFGGAALPGNVYRSDFEDALCTLMGPGLSALVCGAIVLLPWWFGGPVSSHRILLDPHATDALSWRDQLNLIAVVIGILNLAQLIPVLPLDGGRLLRSLLASGPISRRIHHPNGLGSRHSVGHRNNEYRDCIFRLSLTHYAVAA